MLLHELHRDSEPLLAVSSGLASGMPGVGDGGREGWGLGTLGRAPMRSWEAGSVVIALV